MSDSTENTLSFDVVIVGGGPAGLSAAIKLKQLATQAQKEISVAVLEKADAIGGHTLSGAVIDPIALNQLFPDWHETNPELGLAVTSEAFYVLTDKKAWPIPIAPATKNHGNYIVRLGQLCNWMADQAQVSGVEIFPGFPVQNVVKDTQGTVIGVKTMDQGLDKNGQKTDRFQEGVTLLAKHTLLGEGCRGSLTEQVIKDYDLRKSPQTYGLGFKEVWQVKNPAYKPGTVIHTMGWPLDTKTYGGGFCYHLDHNQVALGFVVGLDYENPYLSPFQEFQRYKTHPLFDKILEGGTRVSYGARALNEGGYQSIPTLEFPGGLILGCGAGFMNVPRIKGTHTAMQSGIYAAESVFAQLTEQSITPTYAKRVKESWITKELHQVRNVRPAFQKYGLWGGLIHAGISLFLTRGKEPWTLSFTKADHEHLQQKEHARKIFYPKPDGKKTFDLPSSVYLSNVHHDDGLPCHLHLHSPDQAVKTNLALYDGPESRYCPAGVYEFIPDEKGQLKLQINAQNCLHCKTCDIKDPKQNIKWTPPERGGPNHEQL